MHSLAESRGYAQAVRRLFIVHGLKRSGNHAVIDWLSRQGPFLFYNNLIPIKPILDGTRPMPEPRDFNEFLKKRIGGRIARMRYCYRHLIASIEDHALETVLFSNVRPPITNILIVRSAENLFASRIRKGFALQHPAYPTNTGPLMDRVVTLWKTHAREYLGDTNILSNKVEISFDAWFANPEYREIVSSRLGFKCKDYRIAGVSNIGGGSSFDGIDYDGDGQQMNVLDRVGQLNPGERNILKQVFRDEELVRLAGRYMEADEVSSFVPNAFK